MHCQRKDLRLRITDHPFSVNTILVLAFLVAFQYPDGSFAFMPNTPWRRQLPCLFPPRCFVRPKDTIGGNEEESISLDVIEDVGLDIPDDDDDDDDDGPSMIKFQPEDPFQASGTDGLMKTLAGGPALIFEMARRSIFFVQESSMSDPTRAGNLRQQRRVLPRWHPYAGISDSNPSFRTQSPAMNNQGFANSIWRNVRKRNKPTLWRTALRTYDRMAILEEDPVNYIKIQRSNIHHEGAMLACAKLGMWQRALEIYHYVYQMEQEGQEIFNQQELEVRPTSSTNSDRSRPSGSIKRKRVYVTDNMVLSLVRACVRASRLRSSSRKKCPQEVSNPPSREQEEQEAALRRIPLDTALEVLSTLQEDHNIPLVAYFVNPLASAYQSLGYVHEGREILQTMLSNRTAGEEPEDGVDIFNVYDLCAKDKGSYSLLVQGAVMTGDWGSAVEALADMTNAGLYPNHRHGNVWSEISERQSRPRAVGSWKKKRNDYWTDSVR